MKRIAKNLVIFFSLFCLHQVKALTQLNQIKAQTRELEAENSGESFILLNAYEEDQSWLLPGRTRHRKPLREEEETKTSVDYFLEGFAADELYENTTECVSRTYAAYTTRLETT